jgi:hypothetical protein
VKHITLCPGTLPARTLSRKSPARPDRHLLPSFFSSLIPSSHKTGLMASLLVAVACFPPAMLAQEGYSATATVVYVAANGSNDLISTSGSPGGWTTGTPVTGQQSPIAPAMTRFGQYFVLAYVANNGSDDLLATFSTDAVNWTTGVRVTGQFSALSPALTVFNNKLVLAYVANNGSHDLLVTTSTNGVTWTPSTPVTGQSSAHAPALAVLGDELVLAYVANNGSNDLLVTTSTDGVNWSTSAAVTGQSSGLAPALTVYGHYLVLAYVANNGSHDLLVTFSTNGVNWTTSTPVTGQQSPATPAIAVMPNPIDSPTPFTTFNLIMVYVANNGSNDLLVTTSVNGINWTTSTQITGQSSRVAPALRISESYNPD